MFATFIIVLREVFEIALILGVLLAATRNLEARGRWIWGGLGLGILGSVIVARFANVITDFAEGMGQELLNALILVFASILIGWTTIWMRRYGRQLTLHMKEVGAAVMEGKKPLHTLAAVVGLMVLREGSEIVLFVYGIMSTGESAINIMSGSMLGLVCGTAAGAAVYYGLIRVSPKHFFGVAGWLLLFVAAGMMSQASVLLVAAGWLPEIAPVLWNTSSVIPEHGLFGQILHALIGYSESPSGTQVISYLAVLGILAAFLKHVGSPTSNKPDGSKSVIKEG